MKKAVIVSGAHQYVVSEGESIDVELIKEQKGPITFEPLMIIDGTKTTVGAPIVKGVTVSASISALDTQQDKVTSIRYKAKKRVRKVRGHRQRLTTLKIESIK